MLTVARTVAQGLPMQRRSGRGAAGVWWPIRSSKPAGRSSPPVGWFDSIAAPWTRKPLVWSGGGRTHVRGRVKDSFYERTTASHGFTSAVDTFNAFGGVLVGVDPGAVLSGAAVDGVAVAVLGVED